MHLFRHTSIKPGLAAVAVVSLVATLVPVPAAADELAAPAFNPNLVTPTATVANGNDTLSAAPVSPADTPTANGTVSDFITKNNQPQITVADPGGNLLILGGDCVQLLRAAVIAPTTAGALPTIGSFSTVAAASRATTTGVYVADTNAGLLAGRVPDGKYVYRYQVRRPASTTPCNIGTAGTIIHTSGVVGTIDKPITIDTTIAAPAPDLLATSDTGPSNSDNVTNPTAVTAAGLQLQLDHPEEGVKVDLHRTGNKLTAAGTDRGTLVTDARSTTAAPTTFPTTSGNYGYTATWVDRAGNTLTSVLTVTMDFDNPSLPAKLDLVSQSDTGTSDNDDITKVTTPTFLVSGVEDTATVFLYRCAGAAACSPVSRAAQGGVLATRIGNGLITAPQTPQNSPTNTSWRFTVGQRDLSGRFSGGPTANGLEPAGMGVNINVVVDATAEPTPAAPVLLESSQTGSGASAEKTSTISPTFNVAKGTGRVELLRDGVVVGSSVGAGDITDPGPLADGVYRYTARSTDTAGNVSAESAATTVTIAGNNGYWLLGQDGGVFSFGNAQFFGSTGDLKLNAPVMSMAVAPKKDGYWLLAKDGGVFSFGNVEFFGSTGDLTLNSPIAGMVPTSTGKGYWLFAEDAGVFTFGDAPFHGSPAGTTDSPVVAMVATVDNKGYWLITKKGKVYAYGSAAPLAGVDNISLNFAIVGASATPSGNGLWLVASDGGIFALGDAAFHGSAGDIVLNKPIIGMLSTADGSGYLLIASDGGVFTFGKAVFLGSTGDIALNAPIVGIAAS